MQQCHIGPSNAVDFTEPFSNLVLVLLALAREAVSMELEQKALGQQPTEQALGGTLSLSLPAIKSVCEPGHVQSR